MPVLPNEGSSGEDYALGSDGTIEIGNWIRRAVIMALGALTVYWFHPQIIDVLSSAPRLRTIHARWFWLMIAAEVISFACTWWLIRIVLPGVSWFVASTSQLCANAVSRIIPGGAALAGATLYRMLSVSGVSPAKAGGALAATSILSTAALFAIPATAVLLALLGAPVPESLWPAAVAGGVMFVILVGGGWLAVRSDRLLRAIAGVVGVVVARVSGWFGTARRIDPDHVVAERNRLVATVDAAWGRAIVAAAGNWVFDYLALISALYAVGANPRLSIVLLAYAGAAVLTMIPTTPGGFGFVEAGLVSMLVVSGISAQNAALATAAYRAVSLLLPVVAAAPAFLAYRHRYRSPSDGGQRSSGAPEPSTRSPRAEAATSASCGDEDRNGERQD